MKTIVNAKGVRRPEYGCQAGFRINDKTGLVHEYFIRGQGWKRAQKSDKFVREEIPDLAKPFTHDQFRAYANQYGVECAQEFLECCDMMKPHQANEIMTPDPRKPSAAEQQDFKELFSESVFKFQDALTSMFHYWSFDILKFDLWMHSQSFFVYDESKSCRDNVVTNFGPKAATLLDALLNRDTAVEAVAVEA